MIYTEKYIEERRRIEGSLKIEPKTLVLRRHDLNIKGYNKKIQDIEYTDISKSVKPIKENSIVFFIDYNGDTKLLKNRYGNIITI